MAWLNILVVIIILILIDSFRGENIHISLTKTKHTWFQARNKCSLIGNEYTNINISTVNSDPIWTSDSARYLPWVEYMGCYVLKAGLIVDKTNVEPGKQLKECLLHCKQNDFIGLQQSNCVCLHYLKLTVDYLEKPCNAYPAKCQGDQTAFCGSGNPSYISDAFSIYQKVNVIERLDNGNCLAVDRQIDSVYYVAHNCSTEYFQICLNGSVHQQNNMENRTWIDSFNICFPSYMLSRYSLVYNANFTRIGIYWLSNTRRWIQGTFPNPEFCIATRVQEDGHLERFPIRCEIKLPGLCVSLEVTTKHVSPSDDQAPIDKVLVISVIAVTSLTIIVAIVIVILCMRRTYLRSERPPTLVVQTEVVYENTSNDLRRNQTANDTIDHMHYQSLNQNRNPIDNNYDILHSAEVAVASDRLPQRGIGETTEQRQMVADYQEIQDVSI